MALWVEKHHGNDGPRYIAEQIGRLVVDADKAGVETWVAVAKAFDQLTPRKDGTAQLPTH